MPSHESDLQPEQSALGRRVAQAENALADLAARIPALERELAVLRAELAARAPAQAGLFDGTDDTEASHV